MSHSPAPQATAYAVTRAAIKAGVAVARTPVCAGIAALILPLLARLLARTEPAWDLPEPHEAEGEYIVPTWFVMGRAPHAAAFEAGLVPDWIFTPRNRGMSSRARTAPAARHPAARDPPR